MSYKRNYLKEFKNPIWLLAYYALGGISNYLLLEIALKDLDEYIDMEAISSSKQRNYERCAPLNRFQLLCT